MKPDRLKSRVSPARRAAFEILRRVESTDAYAAVLLAEMPASVAKAGLSSEDRGLAQELTFGVLRWRRMLDYFIERYTGRAVAKLDQPVLLALRLALYQIRCLSRIPHAAAVNEAVNMVRSAGVASAAGMVNGALRNATRHLDDLPGHEVADPLERAAIEASHPTWILQRWRAPLGDVEAQQLALANNQPPTLAFRVNTLGFETDEIIAQLRSDGARARPSEYVPGAYVVDGGAPAVARAAERGLVYVQDAASQLVALLLEPRSGQRILDLCAAPGSKATHLAALTGDQAWIIAGDVHPHRLATLQDACRRLGIASIDAVALDAARELPISRAASGFDRVLVDSPCSGTGTLRRNPEIKWRLTPGDIPRLAELQLQLLTRAASAVTPGGRLVYSTCSIEPEENEDVIRLFLARDRRFRVALPDADPALITPDGFVRTWPHRHGMDGFFAAVLEQVSGS